MSWQTDMVNLMRDQGALNNPKGIQFGVMVSPTACKVGNLPLTEQDLYYIDGLLQPKASVVAGHCPADGELADKSKYIPALAAGDMVALIQMSETRYLILGKVVSLA